MSAESKAPDKDKDNPTNPNSRYSFTDAVGNRHIFKAGEDGVTEEWIAYLRYCENRIHSSDFHFYHRWNGKHYKRRVLRMDTIPVDELEHYPSMSSSKDSLTLLIEDQDRAIFERRFKAAMDSLTDQQWRLVYKRFELGMSDTEIAEEEGVSKMAISKRWDRIQAKINKFFSE